MSKFEINDMDEFTESARRLVFSSFGKSSEDMEDELSEMMDQLSDDDETEMDNVLTHKESRLIVESLVHKQKNKKSKKIRYIMTEKIFTDILEALNARLVSNILSNLSQKGLVESAYDDKLNDFVFWIKEDDSQEQKNRQKPETN